MTMMLDPIDAVVPEALQALRAPGVHRVQGARRARFALVLLALSTFVFITVENMPIGLLTLIAPSLGASPSRIGYLVTGYGAIVALTSIPLTRLTMRFSRRDLLCAALLGFTVSLLGTTLATNYGVLLASRLLAALSHAVFWSIVATTAISLFPASSHGRVVSSLFAGSSLGAVLGVPLATEIGQRFGWRTGFACAGVLSLLILIGLAALLPSGERTDAGVGTGTAPDRRQYRLLLLVTAIGVVGVFTAQTYVTLFLTSVAGVPEGRLGWSLLLIGLTGFAGVFGSGWLSARSPHWSVAAPLATVALAMPAAWLLSEDQTSVIACFALLTLAFSALGTAVQVRILTVAPGSTDLASAADSSVFNVGIGGGALLGGGVVSALGVQATPLVAGLIAAAALVTYLVGIRDLTTSPPPP